MRMAIWSPVISRLKMPQDLAVLGGVDGDVDGQGALAHGGPGPQDHHVGPLQPAQVLVQVGEPGHHRHPRNQPRVGGGGLLLEELVVELPEGDEAPSGPAAPHSEEGVLGLADGGVQVVGVVVSQGGDARAGVYQFAHGGGAGDGLGVVLGVG